MTNNADMTWLREFAAKARRTDRFDGHPDQVALLAAGMLGEAGSVLAELKKKQRERTAYPAFRRKMIEEIGDFLWYFVRLVDVVDVSLLAEFEQHVLTKPSRLKALPTFLEFGSAAGAVVNVVGNAVNHDRENGARELLRVLRNMWLVLLDVALDAQVSLAAAASQNLAKIESRWPRHREYTPLFDDAFPEHEQLPRLLEVEFRECMRGDHHTAVLRCNGINFGDRLTDNIEDSDGYRFHDIFHFAYCVHLGWSPVVRSLLRCKRKSVASVDEAQDGARAAILEEAVSAVVFNRAKQMDFFAGQTQLDYDLLKSVREFVHGYEVEVVPLWQWEQAILDGYRMFRELRGNNGGRVILDLRQRSLRYYVPTSTTTSAEDSERAAIQA